MNDLTRKPDCEYESGTGLIAKEWWDPDTRKAHRLGAPAKTWTNGQEEWYLDGVKHREDGPAVTGPWTMGNEEWYLHGMRHRTDGPAVIGLKRDAWWVKGYRTRSPGLFQKLTDTSDEEMLALILKWGPVK